VADELEKVELVENREHIVASRDHYSLVESSLRQEQQRRG
jgi:hypothetical protein